MIHFNDLKADYHFHKTSIDKSIQRVLESGWYILGKQVQEFENNLANYSHTKFAIGVASGLDALEIGLKALDIGKGDEVITSPVSAFATALAIINVGAIPVFVDIDPQSGLITPKSIKTAITSKTKAVIPVNLYGQMIDIQSVSSICKKHKIFLIEDSAQAIGASINGIKTGQLSDLACLSFYPTKNLGAYGDGGAIITNSSSVSSRAQTLRNYGQDKTYHHIHIGKNSRLDELQAVILNAKFKKLSELIKKRQAIAKLYSRKIINPKIEFLNNHLEHTFHLFVIKTKNRDKLQKYLLQNNIQSLIHYPIPQYAQPAMQDVMFSNKCTSKSTEDFCNQILSIPIHPYLSKSQVSKIIEILNSY